MFDFRDNGNRRTAETPRVAEGKQAGVHTTGCLPVRLTSRRIAIITP
jgi:hypothetical protein